MTAEVPNGIKATPLTRLTLYIVTFLSLNASLNLIVKYALGHYGFRFPFLLTSCHMGFSFFVLAPVALMRESWDSHCQTLAKQWKGFVYIGACMALNLALNNISLLDISLTLNQIIRSAMPVVTCMLAIAVESRYPSQKEVVALLVLSIGVMLAVWQGALTGKPYAILFCIAGTVCNAAMVSISGKLLSGKLDVVQLAFYTSPVSLVCLAPFFWVYERASFLLYLPAHTNGVAFIIIISSINAVCYNMIHSLVIQKTSSVTTAVLGQVKIIGLLILSAMLLGESKEFTLKFTAGCVLALLGFAMYSHTQIVKSRHSMEPQLVNSSGEEAALLEKGSSTSNGRS